MPEATCVNEAVKAADDQHVKEFLAEVRQSMFKHGIFSIESVGYDGEIGLVSIDDRTMHMFYKLHQIEEETH